MVDAAGAGVAEVRAGDRVVSASARGSYAEYIVVPAAKLVPVPGDVTFEQAAAAHSYLEGRKSRGKILLVQLGLNSHSV